MKAIYFNSHGEIEVLRYGDIETPQLKSGFALVAVKACALNHLDIWVRKGWKGLNLEMPHIGGSDISGLIAEVNPGSKFVKDEKVIIAPGFNPVEDSYTKKGEHSLSPKYQIIGEHFKGGLAEYVLIPEKNIIKAPLDLSFEELAAPILVGLTSWRMLFTKGNLKKGETVLVVGAGGGVNSMSILLAKTFEAKVIVVSRSEEKCRQASKLGADIVLSSNQYPNWAKEVLKLTDGVGANIVIDNVGAATFANSLTAVARGGKIITVGNTSGFNLELDNRFIFTKQVSILGSTMGSPKDLSSFLNFYWANNLKIPIDSIFPLKDSIRAIAKLEQGEQFGKIVVRV